jgi:hypothetical protein
MTGNTVAHGELHRFFRQPQQMVERPVLDELADRRRADERASLDGAADTLADAQQGFDVRDDGAHGAVGPDAHAVADDLAHDGFDVGHGVDPGARQADVASVDAELFHEMDEAQLLLERRILDRRALQPVAQRLVVELELGLVPESEALEAIPIEDELRIVRGHRASFLGLSPAASGWTRRLSHESDSLDRPRLVRGPIF